MSTPTDLLPIIVMLAVLGFVVFGFVGLRRRQTRSLLRIGEAAGYRLSVDPTRPGDRRVLLEVEDSGWRDDQWLTPHEAEAIGQLLIAASETAA